MEHGPRRFCAPLIPNELMIASEAQTAISLEIEGESRVPVKWRNPDSRFYCSELEGTRLDPWQPSRDGGHAAMRP